MTWSDFFACWMASAASCASCFVSCGESAAPAAADDGEIEFVAEKSWAQRDAELRAKAVVLDDGEGTMPSQGSSATKDEAAMPGCVYMSDGTIVID